MKVNASVYSTNWISKVSLKVPNEETKQVWQTLKRRKIVKVLPHCANIFMHIYTSIYIRYKISENFHTDDDKESVCIPPGSWSYRLLALSHALLSCTVPSLPVRVCTAPCVPPPLPQAVTINARDKNNGFLPHTAFNSPAYMIWPFSAATF